MTEEVKTRQPAKRILLVEIFDKEGKSIDFANAFSLGPHVCYFHQNLLIFLIYSILFLFHTSLSDLHKTTCNATILLHTCHTHIRLKQTVKSKPVGLLRIF